MLYFAKNLSEWHMDKIKVGVVTTSDRASAGIYEDISGKAIMDTFNDYLLNDIEYIYRCIPDEQAIIEETLLELAKEWECDIIVTTGGTGPAPRDVTTEATEAVCQKLLPGFGEQMRAVSLQYVPTAILSRQTAGICEESLIVNLPGKPKSIRECLDAVFPAIPYCIDLIGGSYMEANEEVVKVFRPKK
jgi:molybdopterin adenylyltransferase